MQLTTLSEMSAYLEKCVTQVEVIRVDIQVIQEIVGVCLRDIRPVQIQTEEHDESPNHYPEVNFPNNAL